MPSIVTGVSKKTINSTDEIIDFIEVFLLAMHFGNVSRKITLKLLSRLNLIPYIISMNPRQ